MNRIESPQFPQRELFENTLKVGDNIKYRGEVYEIEKVTRLKCETLLTIKIPVQIPTYAVEAKVFKINITNNDM